MTAKEEILWYFALCECIHEDDNDLIFSEYFRWADDIYHAMLSHTRYVASRYDRWLEYFETEVDD